MKPPCLLLLAVAAVAETSLPWIDISGPWKTIEGDDPRYSAPNLDDSQWSVIQLPSNAPLQRARESRYFWLRRTVTLPAGISRSDLALTVGPISENYELFVDGVNAGGAGGFTLATSQIARPRTFDLPAGGGARISIAIRVWMHGFPGHILWSRVPDSGPYVITASACLALAVILLLLYFNERSRPELFWLGAYGLLTAWRLYVQPGLVTPDATPWRWFVPLGAVQNTVLVEFILAAFYLPARWIRITAWAALAAQLLFVGAGYWGSAFLQVGVAALLCWAAIRPGPRRSGHRVLLTGLWILWAYNGTINGSVIVDLWAPLRPFFQPIPGLVPTLFLLLNVLVLTRRSLADGLERQRLANELDAARGVQQLLVSKSAGDGVEYVYEPAQEVGGDFYQSRDDGAGGFLLLVGDVSGKGLKAAMLVSMLFGALRRERSSSPAQVLAGLNEALHGQTGGGFVTCCCAHFAADGSVTMANAGHPSPYCDGEEADLAAGLPLGVVPEAEYAESHLSARQFTFVSDGVIEAANAKGELFGFDRTREISGAPAAAIAEAAKAWGQNDDITVVTVRRQEVGNAH
jgi:hypothetical protein